jgi:hypothetical protein
VRLSASAGQDYLSDASPKPEKAVLESISNLLGAVQKYAPEAVLQLKDDDEAINQEGVMVGGNLDAFPSRGLSMNPSLQQVESDVQAPSIAEEDFLEDLRDPEVIKYEKSLLIDDVVINPKVFAAWARSFK